jgi:hypothetical protein
MMTMRKIKNIKQLHKEKKLLHQREKELIKEIGSGWHELKKDLRPGKILQEQIRECREEKDVRNVYEDNIFKSILSFSASLLARKLAKRTEETIGRFFS